MILLTTALPIKVLFMNKEIKSLRFLLHQFQDLVPSTKVEETPALEALGGHVLDVRSRSNGSCMLCFMDRIDVELVLHFECEWWGYEK